MNRPSFLKISVDNVNIKDALIRASKRLARTGISLPKRTPPEPSKGALFMKNTIPKNHDSPVKLIMPVDYPELRLPVDLMRRIKWAYGVLTGRYHAIEFIGQGGRLVNTHSDRLNLRAPGAPKKLPGL